MRKEKLVSFSSKETNQTKKKKKKTVSDFLPTRRGSRNDQLKQKKSYKQYKEKVFFLSLFVFSLRSLRWASPRFGSSSIAHTTKAEAEQKLTRLTAECGDLIPLSAFGDCHREELMEAEGHRKADEVFHLHNTRVSFFLLLASFPFTSFLLKKRVFGCCYLLRW